MCVRACVYGVKDKEEYQPIIIIFLFIYLFHFHLSTNKEEYQPIIIICFSFFFSFIKQPSVHMFPAFAYVFTGGRVVVVKQVKRRRLAA